MLRKILLLIALLPLLTACSALADDTISNGLTVTIPSAGSTNWSTKFKNTFATPISGHDHTGSGKGVQISTNAISSNAVTESKIRLTNNSYLRARNAANNGDINICKADASDKIRFDSSNVSANTRSDLGLAIGTNVEAWDADLDAIAALSHADSNFIVGDGSTWVAESGSTARTSLGVGSGDSPTWTGATYSGLTASSLVATDAGKALTSTTSGISPTFTNETLSGSLILSSTSGTIKGTSSDGSDNQGLTITPASGTGTTRGATIALYGNEHAQAGQAVLLSGGNGLCTVGTSGTGGIEFYGNGSSKAGMSSSGVFNISSLTASAMVQTDGSKNLVSTAYGRSTWSPTFTTNTGSVTGNNVTLASYFRLGSDIWFDVCFNSLTLSGAGISEIRIPAPVNASNFGSAPGFPVTLQLTASEWGAVGWYLESNNIVLKDGSASGFFSTLKGCIQGRYPA